VRDEVVRLTSAGELDASSRFSETLVMYKIVGADQKEYGPVTEEQLRQWIAEGRANAQSVVRFGDGPWKPLSTFPEFASALGMAAGPSQPQSPPPASPTPPLTLPGRPGSGLQQTNGMAIAGLICSIVGLFCCGPVFSTVGLILSALALAQINQDPVRWSGKGVAITGIVLAIVGYALFALFIFTGLFKRTFRRFRFGRGFV
jgi:hypothetical protein